MTFANQVVIYSNKVKNPMPAIKTAKMHFSEAKYLNALMFGLHDISKEIICGLYP